MPRNVNYVHVTALRLQMIYDSTLVCSSWQLYVMDEHNIV